MKGGSSGCWGVKQSRKQGTGVGEAPKDGLHLNVGCLKASVPHGQYGRDLREVSLPYTSPGEECSSSDE